MKKPLVIFATCGSLFGVFILATCTYYEWAFGNGNFSEVVYVAKVDPISRTVDRSWAEAPTAERTPFNSVNMWALGTLLLVSGPAILALDIALGDNRHF